MECSSVAGKLLPTTITGLGEMDSILPETHIFQLKCLQSKGMDGTALRTVLLKSPKSWNTNRPRVMVSASSTR